MSGKAARSLDLITTLFCTTRQDAWRKSVILRVALLTAQQHGEQAFVGIGDALEAINLIYPLRNNFAVIKEDARTRTAQIVLPSSMQAKIEETYPKERAFSLESYLDETIVLHAQLALSRKQNKKIYLSTQDNKTMREVITFLSMLD